MALSEEERRHLEELERELTEDDPELARKLAPWTLNGVRRTAGLCIVLQWAGLVLLIIGIISQAVLIGVAGFLLMIGSIYRMLALPLPRNRP